jgi:RNA polymerase sigma factor (sigma-70 family)
MKLNTLSDTEMLNDAQLVELGLDGNREAFGQLVSRYQSPLCAVAYSSCGDISQSQDLAQETFIIAWRKLRDLKEPAKFKSWLFGIARNLNNTRFRQQTRNPLAGAEPLDEGLTAYAVTSSPTEQAMSKEEEGILWRSLENIPDTYREPLILFYREHQSIERVASVLDLTEEAVRQRLSRGRKLLHERVVAFVEGALEHTAPGQAFTLGVLSALPGITMAAGSSAMGGAALKGAATGKSAGSVGFLATLLGPFLGLLPLLAANWVSLKQSESSRERKFIRLTWTICWVGTALYFGAMKLAVHVFAAHYGNAHPRAILWGLMGGIFGYCVLAWSLWSWAGRIHMRIKREEPRATTTSTFPSFYQPYEYRSRRMLFGLPLIHILFHGTNTGKKAAAKGWIAIGTKAYGILFASGGVAVGCVSMGGLAIGVVGIGGFGIGGLAFGGSCVGIAAIGGAALGYMAYGGAAIGWLAASGGAALAHHFAVGGSALAQHANDQAAQVFMRGNPFFRHAWAIFDTLILLMGAPVVVQMYLKRRFDRKTQAAKLSE